MPVPGEHEEAGQVPGEGEGGDPDHRGGLWSAPGDAPPGDVGEDEVMIEISGRENKVEAFIERMRSFGITELVRSGLIAMVRSVAAKKEESNGAEP